MTQNQLLDYEIDLHDALDFVGNQRTCGYKGFGNTLLRVKDHEANYGYFSEAVNQEGYKKIISVNFTGNKCRNEYRLTKEEFMAENPDVEVVEITFNCEDVSVSEAVELIKSHL